MSSAEVHGDGSCIKELPKSTVRLIGSSQVITSVLSVVKELTENSLDAGATSVEVKLDNYGFDKIEVRDNGSGIEQRDTPYMGQPHYTSKLTTTDDLQRVETFGFRGEALGSLCCVANVTVTTMTKCDPHSTAYTLNQHGQVMSSKPSHLGQGTTVTATNLFKNLPVRRQFYSTTKKRKEELKRVEDFLVSCGVAHYAVRLSLRHDKNVVWQKTPGSEVKSVLVSVFGNYVLLQMEHVNKSWDDPQVSIEAFLPKPTVRGQLVTRSTNDRCFVYVNRRTVILKEVEKLLRKYCMKAFGVEGSKYPMAYLHFTMSTADVDVNLDPNKTRVLLHNKEKVLKLLESILEDIYGKLETNNQDVDQTLLENNNKLNDSQDSSISAINNTLDSPEIAGASTKQALQTVTNIMREGKYSKRQMDSDPPSNFDDTCENLVADFALEIDTQISDLDQTERLSSPTAKNSTLSQMANDLLNDLAEEDEDISLFDISTPKLNKLDTFQPLYSSTQSINTNTFSLNLGQQAEQISGDICSMMESSGDGKLESSGDGKLESSGDGKLESSGNGKLESSGNGKLESLGDDTTICAERAGVSSKPGVCTSADVGLSRNTKHQKFGSDDRDGCCNFSTGNDVSTEAWAKGTAVKDVNKNSLKPVELHTVTLKQASTSTPRIERSHSTGSSSSKKRILSGNHNVSIQKFLSNNKTPVRSPRSISLRSPVVKKAEFFLSDLREKMSLGPDQSQLQERTNMPLHLMGHLKSHGAWVCRHGDQLSLFQPIRAQEELLYQRLMANHKFPPINLSALTLIKPEYLGGPRLWHTLLNMSRSPPVATDSYTYYTDHRLTSCGITLRHKIDDNEPLVELVAVGECIQTEGVKALCEVLRAVAQNSNVSLSDARPNKVKHFLQGEAVRISRQQMINRCRESVEKLLVDIRIKVENGQTCCFHGKPFFVPLYDLQDLPQSQDSCSQVPSQEQSLI